MKQRTLWLSLAVAVTLAAAALAPHATSNAPSAAVAAATEKLSLTVEGMTCGACAGRIRQALEKLPGVQAVDVDVAARAVTVGYALGAMDPKALADAVTQAGYPARLAVAGAAPVPGGQAATPARRGCGGNCCPPS